MLVSRLVRLRLIHSAEIRELENEMIVSMRDYCKILYSVVFVWEWNMCVMIFFMYV